jgi:hypothetical protein
MKLIKKVTPRSGSTMCYLNKNIKKIKKKNKRFKDEIPGDTQSGYL